MAQQGLSVPFRRGGLRLAFVALLGAAALISCTDTTDLGSPGETNVLPPIQATIGSCSNFDAGGDSFTHHWNCGSNYLVKQTGSGPDLSGAISSAAGSWSLGFGLPSFSYTSSSTASINVVRHGTSTSGKYCGVTATSGAQIDVYTKESSSCIGFWTGTPAQLLLHEFGHAVGLNAPYHNFDVAGYSDHCAMNLPSGTSNTLTANSLCLHEIEEVYSKYSVQSSAPNWGAHIVTGIGVPDGGTVAAGANKAVTVSYLLVANGNPSLSTCPGDIPVEFDRCIALGSATLSWSASPAGKVSLSGGSDGNLTVTGVSAGFATLTATLASNGGYQTSTAWESAGFHGSNSIEVTAPSLAAYSGDNQSALVSTALANPLVVRVTSGGVGIAGTIVTFAVASGGGSLSALADTTDASGYAQTSWTLGATEGYQTVTASASGATGSPVTFYANALPFRPTLFAEYDCNAGLHTFVWSNTPGYTDFELVDNSVNDPATGTLRASGTGETADVFYTVKGTPVYKYLWVRNVNGGTPTGWTALSGGNAVNVSQCLH